MSLEVELLNINRTIICYKCTTLSDKEPACKKIIDYLHTDNTTCSARQMSVQLKDRRHQVGHRKARQYMNEIDIYPTYSKMNISELMQHAKIYPYLLRNAVIGRQNRTWLIEITYVPLRGFLYLTAVIDQYSRCIVG